MFARKEIKIPEHSRGVSIFIGFSAIRYTIIRRTIAGIEGFESRRGHGYLSILCCVLSGRGLCVGLITRPEESYGKWCV
jgi:hypothetical protein